MKDIEKYFGNDFVKSHTRYEAAKAEYKLKGGIVFAWKTLAIITSSINLALNLWLYDGKNFAWSLVFGCVLSVVSTVLASVSFSKYRSKIFSEIIYDLNEISCKIGKDVFTLFFDNAVDIVSNLCVSEARAIVILRHKISTCSDEVISASLKASLALQEKIFYNFVQNCIKCGLLIRMTSEASISHRILETQTDLLKQKY